MAHHATPPSHKLSSELSADDRQLIEGEHARLEQFLQDLYDTCTKNPETDTSCQQCSKETLSICRGRLPSFLHDFHDLVIAHFDTEEAIMRRYFKTEGDHNYLLRHHQEHVRLIRKVEQLMEESTALIQQGKVVVAIQRLYQTVGEIFGEHGQAFDKLLI